MTLDKLLEELYKQDKKIAVNVYLAFHSSKWIALPPPYVLDPRQWNAHVLESNPDPCVSIMVRVPIRGDAHGGLNLVMHTWTRTPEAAWRVYRVLVRNRRKGYKRAPWPFLFYECTAHTLVRYHSRAVGGGSISYTEKAALELP